MHVHTHCVVYTAQYKANVIETMQEAVRSDKEQTDFSEASRESSITSLPPRSWGSFSSITTDGQQSFMRNFLWWEGGSEGGVDYILIFSFSLPK